MGPANTLDIADHILTTADNPLVPHDPGYVREVWAELLRSVTRLLPRTHVFTGTKEVEEVYKATAVVQRRQGLTLRSPIPISQDAFDESQIEMDEFPFDFKRSQETLKWVRKKYED